LTKNWIEFAKQSATATQEVRRLLDGDKERSKYLRKPATGAVYSNRENLFFILIRTGSYYGKFQSERE